MSGRDQKIVLLVEDEAILAMEEAAVLRDYGFQVITASTGEKAVELIERGTGVDLVLMDINLGPGMDGTEAARIILSRRDIPLVFLSSHTERAVVEKTEQITNYGYIVKNSGETVLVAAMKMAFRLHEARRDLERHREALQSVNEDLVRSQVAIMESERRFRTVADYTYDWEYWIAPDGTLQYISPSCERITGYSSSEFIGNPGLIRDIVIPEDREVVAAHNARAIARSAEDAALKIDFRIIRRDGAERWIAHVCQRIVSAKGEFLGIRASNRDITERRLAELALRKSEAFQDSIIEHSPLSMWISDDRGTMIRMNQACRDLLHITDENVVGKYNILQDDIVKEQGLLPLVEEVFTKGKAAQFALSYDSSRLRHLALSEFVDVILEVTISPVIDASGRTVNAIIQHVDVTESRKATREKEAAFAALTKSEEAMRGIFRVAPTGIGLVKNRVLMDVNPRICEMTGYNREELIGENARMLYPAQEDFDFVGSEKYRQIALKGTGSVQTRWRRKDGKVINILLASTPLDLADLSRGVIFTALDITDRVRAEEELRRSRERYQSFVSQSHEAIYCTEFDNPIDTSLPMEAQIDAIYANAYMGKCNQAMAAMYGIPSADEFTGKRLVDFHGGGDNPVNRATWRRFIESGYRIVDSETSEVTESGEPRFFLSSDMGIVENGMLLRIWGSAVDITGRKRVEGEREAALASLRENERLYRLIADNTGDCIWIINMDMRFTYVSPSIVNVRGFTVEEAMAHTIDQVMPPHSVREAMETLAYELELEQGGAAQPGRMHRLVLEEYHKDGTLRWIDNTLTFLRDGEGRPSGILGVSRDITQIKRVADEHEAALAALVENEKKYRTLVENITEIIYTLDLDGTITYVSPVVERMSGYRVDELIGRNFVNLMGTSKNSEKSCIKG